jgi:hypothetical protein
MSSLPILEPHDKNCEYPTPNKAKVQAVIEFNNTHGVIYSKKDVFEYFHIPLRTGWRMISNQGQLTARRLVHDSNRKETRGRKRKITPQQIKAMEDLIQTIGWEVRQLNWLQLGEQVGIDGISSRTIARIMGNEFHYSKCIACTKSYVSLSAARNRLQFAITMLSRYPHPEDWRRVRFSDEVHFGLGHKGKVWIIRKPGERYCSDCIQEVNEPQEKDRKRIHCWAAIGYNFKSEIHFYECKNNNGKLTQLEYISKILEPIVKPWIDYGDDFVLEEDGDSAHGPTKNNNIVRQWKLQNKLEFYINCAQSPDLSPIENVWQPPKAHTRAHAHWDDETLKEPIQEGWDGIIQEWINRRIDSMPVRLKQVIEREGKLCTIEVLPRPHEKRKGVV